MGEGPKNPDHTAHSRTHRRAPGEQTYKHEETGAPYNSFTLLQSTQQSTVRLIYAWLLVS